MKPKRVNKTKDQLIKEAAYNRKLDKMKNEVYPALCKSTKSIDDATNQLYLFNAYLMEKFLGFMKEKKFSDLDIKSTLNKDDEHYKESLEFLSLFDDMNVFDAKAIIEGLKTEIELFVTLENKKRPLSELTTMWKEPIK